jgi:ADP-ribose pyrophosphatase YjhB (NUDIX family)
MAIPEFVLALREKIGSHPLWLAGITAVVLREDEILLVRRADNGAWTPVTGIIDPGEHPAAAAARETLEEADVVTSVDTLAWVDVSAPVVYPNGDASQYIEIIFRCSWVSGDPYPADGENTEAAWFKLDAMPEMSEEMTGRIRHAIEAGADRRF